MKAKGIFEPEQGNLRDRSGKARWMNWSERLEAGEVVIASNVSTDLEDELSPKMARLA
jgi:hypothetical protein